MDMQRDVRPIILQRNRSDLTHTNACYLYLIAAFEARNIIEIGVKRVPGHRKDLDATEADREEHERRDAGDGENSDEELREAAGVHWVLYFTWRLSPLGRLSS